MARQENYKILIGTNIASSVGTTVASIVPGEISVVKNDMTRMIAGDTISDSDYCYIVQGVAGVGAAPKFSAKIQGLNVSKWNGVAYAPAVQQVSVVGAQAGVGLVGINVVNSVEYTLSIIFTYDKVIGSERQLVRRFNYTSDATATQQEIATALAAAVNADQVAATLMTATPLVGGAVGVWGITLTGLPQTYDIIDGYEQVTWKIALGDGFTDGGTTVLHTADGLLGSVIPIYGSGTFPHVSDKERAALGYDGITNLMRFPIPSYPVYAVSTALYDMYTIMHSDQHATANLNKDGWSPEMTIVAIDAQGGVGNGQKATFEGLINPWMNSLSGSFLAVNL
tara:strand:- start:1156 stop:2172 length:1017 start_codon:yes stop_codon:yes gene_type:complete